MSKAGDIKEFRQGALKLVNFKRALHAAPALKASRRLDASAQLWAEALAGKRKLENSAEALNGDYGESISCRNSQADSTDITADEVINQWYGERVNFDFKDPTSKGNNFTQMIWLDSLKVGFGKAHAKGKVIVVAHYSPAGNYKGQYATRVRPSVTELNEPSTRLAGELADFRITKREVLRDEEVVAGQTIIVERERAEYEDSKGNTKEKITERRQQNPTSPSGAKAEASSDSQQGELRQGAILPIKEKELNKFSKELLSQVNKYRSKHGVKSLKLSTELGNLAQSFAEELSRKTKLYNSGTKYKDERLGESIASRWSNGATDYGGEEVADHWYSEMENYRFHEEPNNVKGFGNFTQIIWKNSKELGVGKAIHRGTDGSHRVVVVCYFYPAGNVVSHFRENVLPLNK